MSSRKNIEPGCKFIVFEGGEGSGKTTQVDFARKWLTSIGFKVSVTAEPGGTQLGAKIRSLLLGKDYIESKAELLLYMADRAQHVREIKSMLDAYDVVLCDRYIYSTIAYQGYGKQLDLAAIDWLNDFTTDGLKPDLVLWLDLPPEVGLTRAMARGKLDRIESKSIEFHRRVRTGFTDAFTRLPPNKVNWAYIDANKAPDLVHADIRAMIYAARLIDLAATIETKSRYSAEGLSYQEALELIAELLHSGIVANITSGGVSIKLLDREVGIARDICRKYNASFSLGITSHQVNISLENKK